MLIFERAGKKYINHDCLKVFPDKLTRVSILLCL